MKGAMDGLKLAHAACKRWPPVWIMVASGAVQVTAAQMPENGVFFGKPYTLRFLLATIQKIAAQISS
jgi:hypothetical protein